MKKSLEYEADPLRRYFLQTTGRAAATAFLTAFLFPVFPAAADDGESDGDGEGEGEGEGESDGDGEGDSDGHDSGGDDGGDDGGHDRGGDGEDDHDKDDDDGGTGNDFGRGTLDQSDAVRAVQSGQAIPLKSALNSVERRYNGTVIDVTLRSTGRRLEYRFKIRTERGTVRTIRMDAGTGRFLGLGALFR